jgi:hypothetical protein
MHSNTYFKLQRNVKMSLGKRRVGIDFASTTSKTLYSYFKFDEFIMANRLLKGIGNSFYSSSCIILVMFMMVYATRRSLIHTWQ